MDEKRCDDPAPHDPHEWDEEHPHYPYIYRLRCPGRKAHANVMIGRE